MTDMVQIPRDIAVKILDLICTCLVCVAGTWEHQTVIAEIKAALKEKD